MSARDDIAAAVSNVEKVNVTPHYRQTLKPFEGFVRWSGQVQSSNRFGWINTWQVWIALPQDVKAAEEWLDENLGTLVGALNSEVIVTSATPAELVLGQNTVNGLILEGALSASG